MRTATASAPPAACRVVGSACASLDGHDPFCLAGRRPYTKGLNLEGVGVATDGRGCIVVDNHFQSSVPGVYAIGDVIPGPMLAHKVRAGAADIRLPLLACALPNTALPWGCAGRGRWRGLRGAAGGPQWPRQLQHGAIHRVHTPRGGFGWQDGGAGQGRGRGLQGAHGWLAVAAHECWGAARFFLAVPCLHTEALSTSAIAPLTLPPYHTTRAALCRWASFHSWPTAAPAAWTTPRGL